LEKHNSLHFTSDLGFDKKIIQISELLGLVLKTKSSFMCTLTFSKVENYIDIEFYNLSLKNENYEDTVFFDKLKPITYKI
jgi:PP-loop superfamily ATP-utilizing enzyme